MKRNLYTTVTAGVALAAMLLAALLPANVSAGGPAVNGALIKTRIFNDCPTSIVTTLNGYPSVITIGDADLSCFGFANLHVWRFSSDGGATEAAFNNNSSFKYSAILVITGTGDAEAGLQVAPWWSHDVDGRLNVRSTDGEIACFGGRLPFYSFTASAGLRYAKGEPIYLEIKYHPNGLSEASPATIEYIVGYAGTMYTSGPLNFDEGNPAEGYGSWGMLDDGRVGGHIQVFLTAGVSTAVQADWMDITYNAGPTATENSTWGTLKSLYK